MNKRSGVTEAQSLEWQDLWPGEPDPDKPRILVVGDLHQRLDHATAWTGQDADQIVFIGDYFDAYDDETEDTINMALWVKDRVHDPRCTLLLGNHDVHYRWPWESLIAPGFTPDKARAIASILNLEDWGKMRLACMAGRYLLSHAGFSPIWTTPPTVDNILARCKLAEDRAAKGVVDPVFGNGELPGGAQKWGGPLAMDFSYFAPIPGVSQIVGHTPGDDVRVKATDSGVNLCIDVGNGAVAALVQGDHVKILRIQELGIQDA